MTSLIGGSTGPQGRLGPQGIAGSSGTQGPQGVAGIQGPQGVAGIQGPQGPSGNGSGNGSTGPQGPQGPSGNGSGNGSTGPQGVAGPQGVQGIAGSSGTQGPQGAQGSATPAGYDIILVAGQSNCHSGQGMTSDETKYIDTVSDRVYQFVIGGPPPETQAIFNNGGANANVFSGQLLQATHIPLESSNYSFGLSFAKNMLKYIDPNRKIILIDAGWNGSPIASWLPGNELFNRACWALNKALNLKIGESYTEANNRFMCICWIQGESDDGITQQLYTTQMQSVAAGFRNTFYVKGTHSTVPFIVNTTSQSRIQANPVARSGYDNAHKNAYNTVPYSEVSLSPDWTSDGTHFTAAAHRVMANQQALAYRVAVGNDLANAPSKVVDFRGGWVQGKTKLRYDWMAPPGHSDYFLLNINGIEYTINHEVGKYNYSYISTGAQLQTYTATVRGVNELTMPAFYGTGSDAIVTTPSSPNYLIPAPTNLVITPGISNIGLTWDSPTEYATEYYYEVITGLSVVSSATTFKKFATITGLTSNTTYTVNVYSKFADNLGDYVSGSATTTGIAPPTSLGATTASHTINLSWTASADADKYRVLIIHNSSTVIQVDVNSLVYTASGLTNNTTYNVYVYSMKNNELGAYATIDVTIPTYQAKIVPWATYNASAVRNTSGVITTTLNAELSQFDNLSSTSSARTMTARSADEAAVYQIENGTPVIYVNQQVHRVIYIADQAIPLGSYSIMVLFKLKSTPDSYRFMYGCAYPGAVSDPNSNVAFGSWTLSNWVACNNFASGVGSGPVNGSGVNSITSADNTTWYTVHITYNNTTQSMSLYVNGVLNNTAQGTQLQGDFNWVLGHWKNGNNDGFNFTPEMYIAEINLFDTELASDDVINLYTGTKMLYPNLGLP